MTATQVILLAADDLMATGKSEFTEWDLTVASWLRDRLRFGLRGYAQSYPDHKRVMMEIMGQKPNGPVQQKFMEKVRPNHYRLTALGRTAAARIRGGGGAGSGSGGGTKQTSAKMITVKELYDRAIGYVSRTEFRRWQDNPEEPREWAGAAAFLGLSGRHSGADPVERLGEIQIAIRAAVDWCSANEVAFLTDGGQGGTPIHIRDLADMLDFLQALKYRFPENLDEPAQGEKKAKKRIPD
ncbi:hypothetical protein [Fimbriiglobus ruber]|nr:hypothetical protein [Fimbriiglobus ruber]